MPRSIKTASGGSTFVSTLSPRQGGTGAENSADALTALNGFKQSELGAPLGIARLNASGGIDASLLTGLSLNEACVDGPALIQVDTTHDYFLTTFDSFEDYEVVAAVGSVSRNKNVITYTANSVAGMGGFSVNGRRVNIAVTDGSTAVVATPSIIAPVSGATNMSTTQTLVASTFVMAVGTDTHASSDWEAATDVNFATVVFSSYDDLLNLTSWTVNNTQPLTKYYVRTRHKSSGGKLSDWSAVSNFTTKGNYPSAQVQLLTSPYIAETEFFGYGVALSSDASTLVVGAPGNDSVFTEQGTAYLFQPNGRGSYALKGQLTSDIPVTSEALGMAVAVSADGNRAVVSAGFNANGRKSEVFVYDNRTAQGTGWTRQQMLFSDLSLTRFGFVVAISADATTIAVGAPYEAGTNANQVGGVYIYTQVAGTWTQQAHLTPGALMGSAQFGYAVALSADGNTALVGAPYEDGVQAEAGAAYVFTRSGSTWTLLKKLSATTPITAAHFGFSVALTADGSRAVVGAPDTKVTQTAGAAAWICQRTVSGTDWFVTARLLANSPVLGETLGYSVAISSDGNTVLAGAPGINATNQSTVHRACVFKCAVVKIGRAHV